MTINDIVKDIPFWVPLGITGLCVAGIVTDGTIKVYKAIKRTNARFKELQNTYRNDFSKDELIGFYGDLVLKVKPGLWGKRSKIATQMTKDLEDQIMIYVTQEVNEAISKGAILDFRDSIMQHSPTYKRAIELFHSYRQDI